MTSALDALLRAPGRGGRPLPGRVRARLERGLGATLAAVRTHTGPVAGRLAATLGADAVTSGSHVYFRDGAFRPDTRDGLRLLAHEATHALQQTTGPVGGTRVGSWTVSEPGDPWEQEADRLAARVVAGMGAPGDVAWPVSAPIAVAPRRILQRHVSFEHRMLGDEPTANLVVVSTGGANRAQVLANQISLLNLWQNDPTKVTEADVARLCPWIRTVRLGPAQLLATYGELNALPDYLADATAFDAVPANVLLPILQVIRQEGFNQLTKLRDGTNPNVTFHGAAQAPWRISMVNDILETGKLDQLTFGLGARGENHYQGLLARNACHFAPYSWYRWQASHLIARDLAAKAHAAGNDPRLTHQAWTFHGYADHFLQDSFAAGHLVNKTLVMQWFIEWAAGEGLLPVADWDQIKNMTTAQQPNLGGGRLYDPTYGGPSTDPQTAQEAATLVDRILASAVVASGGTDQFTAYQHYLTFLTSAATQLASGNLHDHYNSNSLWVSSIATATPYEIWGDSTLFSGMNGGNGVRATSETSQMSQEALKDILATGATSITTAQVRQHFPTKAGSSASNQQDLQAWNATQKSYCVNTSFPGFWAQLKTILLKLASPRLGIVSQDQSLASVWSTDLPGVGFLPANTLLSGQRLFVGSNGYVSELNPTTGAVIHSLLVTGSVGVGNYETRLATDGTTLFVGVHGYVYGVRMNDWSKPAWNLSVGGTGFGPVSVLVRGTQLFAGSNGYVYQVDRTSGKQVHQLLLSSRFGQGDYETRLDTDGTTLFAGIHGYVYGVDIGRWTSKWDCGVGGRAAYHPVSVLFANGWVYAGSNGYAYQLNPSTGAQVQGLLVAGSVGVGNYDTRLATDGWTLFVGTHGYLYGVRLSNWSEPAWNVAVGGIASYHPVSVLSQPGRLFAGSNGYVYRVDPDRGTIRQSLLLTYIVGDGDFDTHLATDGPNLYAGVHGYENKLVVNDPPAVPQTLFHDYQTPDGSWHGWTMGFDSAPALTTVTGVIGPDGNLEVLALGPDGTLYHDYQTPDGAWHGWAPNFDSAPAKMQAAFGARGANGNLEVFAIGLDGTLYHDYQTPDGAWHGWTASFDSAPAKMKAVFGVVGPYGNLEVFAIGRDGTLYHDYQTPDGAWHGWTPNFDSFPAKAMSVTGVRGANGNLEVFAVGADGTLYHDYQQPVVNWQGWTPNFDAAPSKMRTVFGVVGPYGNLEVFAISANGTLCHDYQTGDGNWHGWALGFDSAPGRVGAAFGVGGANGNLEVFAIDPAAPCSTTTRHPTATGTAGARTSIPPRPRWER